MNQRRFDLVAGTRDFYVDPVYYDYEFKERRADVRWYTQRYLDADGPALELGVGSGRVALYAARKGAEIIGLDVSESMLKRAEERIKHLPKAHRDKLTLIQGDMRDFKLDRQFNLISCPFNAFQHLYTRQDVERALACVKAHLAPGGLFLFDVLMPDLEYLSRPPFQRIEGIRFKHPTHDAHYIYSERSAYDPIEQLNQMVFEYTLSDAPGAGPEQEEIQLSHRVFYPAELEALLHYNGFEVVSRFGDFEENPLCHDCESQILVCRASTSPGK
ncbi:class I SAM-dependent methyltransferase [Myxococcota bacterium]|nr:class I SAM-dependent methyltransferase [Myxococcota bacterium]MBU1896933.1 class I SAM-dependent methyltransferase [Myxococcota bacterium]